LLRKNFRGEILVRVLADVVLVNAGLAVGLVIRTIGLALFEPAAIGGQPLRAVVLQLWRFFVSSAPLLSVVCLLVFATSGFYTRGRFYRSRYKVIIILQAVSLAYVIFGFLSYFLPFFAQIPRSALVVGWAVTFAHVVIARFWAGIWSRVVVREERIFGPEGRDETIKAVLVIGGAGYIGSELCRRLLNEKYRVRVLDALLYGKESIEPLLSLEDFEFIHGDSRDIESVVRATRHMDAVVHLGEIVGDPASALDERLTREINVVATRMVAQTAKGMGVRRFVYASSCSVYGASDELLGERSALTPVSLYARAKIDAESIILQLQDERFEPVVCRFATVYGLSHRPRFDLVINLLTAKATSDREITVFGGDQWRPFVHVSDVARALALVLKAQRSVVAGEIFNLGSNEQNLTVTMVAEAVQRLIPSARILPLAGDGDRRNYRVDFAKIRDRLGFVPEIAIEAGIREIEMAIREGRLDHYSAVRYSNLRTFREPDYLSGLKSRAITELAERVTPIEDRRKSAATS
jgi:nucleoside-diphosphate-sugar epimerase